MSSMVVLMSNSLGSATRIINCEIGDDLAGQLHRRVCMRIRDDLEANFFYLSNGNEPVLFVSLDLAGLFEWSCTREMTAAMAETAMRWFHSSDAPRIHLSRAAAIRDPATPPASPSQVFFGLTRGAIL